jgi:colanic acid biosynthesis glycosyl transferase WcaI
VAPRPERAPAPLPDVFVLNQYFDSEEATGRVLADLADSLAGAFAIAVVAARPASRTGRGEIRPSGVRVSWVTSTRFGRSSMPLRAVNYATFLARMMVRAARAPRARVVMCMTDPPLVGTIAALIAWRHRARLVVVMQDIHPELGLVSGRLRSRPIAALLRVARRPVLRRADRLVAIGEAMRERLVGLGADPARISVIPNAVDVEAIRPRERTNAWAAEHGLADGFVVMHAGNAGLLQGLETVVEAARGLPDVTFAVVGGGAGREALAAAARDVDNVRLIDRQSAVRLPDVLAAADVHVVSLLPGLAGYIEPSKVYGVLAAGRPLIAMLDADSEGARMVREGDCGTVVAPGDAAALAAAVADLAADRNEARRQGQAARAQAERSCSWDAMVAAYRDLLREVAS